jgi:Transcriptional regulator, AbiEi antitoxin N-terminal domain
LHRVGDGAFTVQAEAPSRLGAVFGLQQKSKSFHPGGTRALELAGLAHFVPLGDAYPLYVFSRTGERLPAWFRGLPWSSRVRHVGTNFLPHDLGLREHREGELELMIYCVCQFGGEDGQLVEKAKAQRISLRMARIPAYFAPVDGPSSCIAPGRRKTDFRLR